MTWTKDLSSRRTGLTHRRLRVVVLSSEGEVTLTLTVNRNPWV